MRYPKPLRIALIACLGIAVAFSVAGCAKPNTEANKQQSANRTYMSQVNQVAETLNTRIASFTDAVSRGDTVGMKTQADNAFKSLDDLSALQPPDGFKDIQAEYVEGGTALKDAMNGYIDLYAEIDAATDAAPFDYGTYDTRLGDIQKKYDDGLAKLKDADKKASEKDE